MRHDRVLIVGAGIGGIITALSLTSRGIPVTVCEQASGPGGKIRSCSRPDMQIDVGPTVFTMPWVFDEILAHLGTELGELVTLERLGKLAHHRWPDGSTLDLYPDEALSSQAIEAFAGPTAAEQYRRFTRQAESMYETLVDTFMTQSRPSLLGLMCNAGPARLAALAGVRPFRTMWQGLGDFFDDPRLRQLFSRYTTYYGSSPFHAPATLMLIAHVEQLGVWRVHGGIRALAAALADLAATLGAEFRYDACVENIAVSRRRPTSATLTSGERIEANRIIVNGDVNALASGRFGADVAGAVAATPAEARSLSAITWAGLAHCGDRLDFHNVLFSKDYLAEFASLIDARALPKSPTIYVHAPDHARPAGDGHSRSQRLFMLINAPPTGDTGPLDQASLRSAAASVQRRLEEAGVDLDIADFEMTTPVDFERRYPATGGGLYGCATHSWQTPFKRPTHRTKLPGLYVTGGSTHPGAGVPMAALSGRMAAECVMADLSNGRNAGRAA